MTNVTPLTSRQPRWNTRTIRESVVGLLMIAAGLNVALGLMVDWRTGQFHDFRLFHASAVAALHHRSLYEGPNLNPPIFVMLTAPLGWLSLRSAWLFWQFVNALAFGWAMSIAMRPTGRPASLAVSVALLHASTAAQTLFGQVAWLLTLPLVMAWRAGLRDRWVRAGALLGVVIAIKPFVLPVLATAALDRRWRQLSLSAVATAVLLSLVSIIMFGVEAHLAWWATGIGAWHSTDQPTIASLTGTLYRLGMNESGSLGGGALVWIPTLMLWRSLDHDRRWLSILAASILLSPLGWIHYSAWLLPFVIAAWDTLRRGWKYAALATATVPPVAVAAWPVLQPLYPASVLALWIACMTGRTSRTAPQI